MKVIIDIDPRDIDWGKSTVHTHKERGPDDAIYTDIDIDLDHCHWNGKRIEFVDDDEACEWFYEDYKEGYYETQKLLEDGYDDGRPT